MPPRAHPRAKAASAPPVRTLVAHALREGKPLTTQQLLRAARAAGGRPFHVNSVRNALRAMRKEGLLTETKKGPRLLFSLKEGGSAPVAPKASAEPESRRPRPLGDLKTILVEALRHGTPMSAENLRVYAGREGRRVYQMSTVRQMLRTLDREGEVSVFQKGRQLLYALSVGDAPAVSSSRLSVPAEGAITTPLPPTGGPVGQKLAPGEAVILHLGETHVETATNVHGKVVLERHARPK